MKALPSQPGTSDEKAPASPGPAPVGATHASPVPGTVDESRSPTPRPSRKLPLSATIGPSPKLSQHGLALVNHGDCLDVMRRMPADFVDLIVTSPPYADARAHTYGGIRPDEYVPWFVERAVEMHRVLKPTGSFVLNIKEKAVSGERHTYVLELILALKREVGFRWVEEYIWHKTTSAPGTVEIPLPRRMGAAAALQQVGRREDEPAGRAGTGGRLDPHPAPQHERQRPRAA